jgi:hypothetical protein
MRLHVQLLLMAVVGGLALVALHSPTLFAGPGARIVVVRDPPRVIPLPVATPVPVRPVVASQVRHRKARPVVDAVTVEAAFLASRLTFKVASTQFALASVRHADVTNAGLADHVLTQLTAMLKRDAKFGQRTIHMPAGNVVVTLFDDARSARLYARYGGTGVALRGASSRVIVRDRLVIRRTYYGGSASAVDAAVARSLHRLGLRG